MSKRKEQAYGRCSLAMLSLPDLKLKVLIYLDLRSNLKGFNYNATDIAKHTGKSVKHVRLSLKELTTEGILERRGKSFYRLNKEKLQKLYSCDADVASLNGDVASFKSGRGVPHTIQNLQTNNLHNGKLPSYVMVQGGKVTKPVTLKDEDWRLICEGVESDTLKTKETVEWALNDLMQSYNIKIPASQSLPRSG